MTSKAGKNNLKLLKRKGLLIDPEDEYIVTDSYYTWTIVNGYVHSTMLRPPYLHQYILLNDDPLLVTDHINRNRLDNRRNNLRLVSVRENAGNIVTKYPTGVSYHKTNKKFRTQITLDGKVIHLGYFKTVERASQAYQERLKTL